ncbi:MAG TPA: glycosyltransferase family 39 protein [Myxococcota bacterium]|nr:glycosyltransferase family 39 protein [Myxococcota bacterium]
MNPRLRQTATGVGFALAVALAASLWAWRFHDRGIVMAEEGQILSEAEAILDGRVLYRDIDGFVAPGVWYLGALILRVAGPDLNATRIAMVVLFAFTALVVYGLCQRVTSRRFALLAVALLCVQKALAFPLGTFLFYTEFAIAFALASSFALLRAVQRGSALASACAGLCIALCMLFKQNIGGVLLLGCLVYLAAFERRASVIAPLLAVSATAGLATLAAFGAVGALPALVHSLVLTPFTGFAPNYSIPYLRGVALSGDFSQLFLYSPALYVEEFLLGPAAGSRKLVAVLVRGLSVGAYLTPLLLALLSARNAIAGRPDARIRSLLWIPALATFASAFPRSDFPHVAQALIGFLPISLYELRSLAFLPLVRAAGGAVVAALVLLALALVARMPHDRRFEHPRARLWLTSGTLEVLSDGLRWIQDIPPQERLSVIPTDAMYYFLSGRQPPLRSSIVLPHQVAADGGRALADSLDREGIDWVLYSEIRLPGFPKLEEFAPALRHALDAKFEPVRMRGERDGGPMLLRRRPTRSGDAG